MLGCDGTCLSSQCLVGQRQVDFSEFRPAWSTELHPVLGDQGYTRNPVSKQNTGPQTILELPPLPLPPDYGHSRHATPSLVL